MLLSAIKLHLICSIIGGCLQNRAPLNQYISEYNPPTTQNIPVYYFLPGCAEFQLFTVVPVTVLKKWVSLGTDMVLGNMKYCVVQSWVNDADFQELCVITGQQFPDGCISGLRSTHSSTIQKATF